MVSVSRSAGNAAFIAKLSEGLRLRAALSPFNAFQIIQELETLPIRVRSTVKMGWHCEVVRSQDQVAWVNYPGLKSSKYYDLAKNYLPKGQNGIVTLG
jgi:O-acetylhomoserine (thiol)-lyase